MKNTKTRKSNLLFKEIKLILTKLIFKGHKIGFTYHNK